jgi:SNF2 family DNA or RNA helicase
VLVKYASGNIEVYDCFNERFRLKSLKFAWRKRKLAWVKKYTPYALMLFLEEFPVSSEYSAGQSFADLIQEWKEENARHKKELNQLMSVKEDLFKNDNISMESFEYPEDIEPFNHQRIACNYFYESPIGNLYGDCGVGKTAIMLMLIERLKRERKIDKVLVITLKNIMYGAWKKDIPKFAPDLKLCILDRGTKINKKILLKDFHGHPKYRKMYEKDFDIYAINFESVHAIKDVIAKVGFDMCIIDESSKLKDPKTKISKACIEIGDLISRKYILSGTPAPNKELEYFCQIRFLTDRVFGDNFWSFRERWFEPVDHFGFKYELDPMRKDEFSSMLYTYGLRFTQEDCLDLPPTSSEFIPAIMDKKLSDVYRVMEKEKVLQIDKNLFPTDNPLSGLLKLRQLSSSYVTDPDKDDGSIIEFKNHKLVALKNFLENNPNEQIIIWAVFRKDLLAIMDLLGDQAVGLFGGVKNSEQAINDFTNGKAKYLVANPSSAGHGLTFVNCRVNLFYSLDYNSENYQQALRRTHRAGQLKNVVYYHLMSVTDTLAPTIDEVMYAAVDGKITRLMDILNLFKEKYEYRKLASNGN